MYELQNLDDVFRNFNVIIKVGTPKYSDFHAIYGSLYYHNLFCYRDVSHITKCVCHGVIKCNYFLTEPPHEASMSSLFTVTGVLVNYIRWHIRMIIFLTAYSTQ